jgi:hypothetical protein
VALVEHAESELLKLSKGEPLDFPEKEVLDLVKLFASQGHSGDSAEHTISLFSKLARFESLQVQEA